MIILMITDSKYLILLNNFTINYCYYLINAVTNYTKIYKSNLLITELELKIIFNPIIDCILDNIGSIDDHIEKLISYLGNSVDTIKWINELDFIISSYINIVGVISLPKFLEI
jgi:hypothetical protein